MKTLGKKKSVNNDDWKYVHDHADEFCPKERILQLEEQAVSEIMAHSHERIAFGWSGGKDSIVLASLCHKAGIRQCLWATCDLEFPAFRQWVMDHKPDELEIINNGMDLKWLAKHQNLLFPNESKGFSEYFSLIQWTAQREYCKKYGLDTLILGRRKKDGNNVGASGRGFYTDGVYRFMPIADWLHEDIAGYVHYYDLELPPIYDWPRGYVIGTHVWPARDRAKGGIMDTWAEVYAIDKSIVEEAAGYIESAKTFIGGI